MVPIRIASSVDATGGSTETGQLVLDLVESVQSVRNMDSFFVVLWQILNTFQHELLVDIIYTYFSQFVDVS